MGMHNLRPLFPKRSDRGWGDLRSRRARSGGHRGKGKAEETDQGAEEGIINERDSNQVEEASCQEGRNSEMRSLLTALDLASLVSGLVGTILLALAVGVPSGVSAGVTVRGRKYPFVFLMAGRWWTGIGFIILAFLLQLAKLIPSLRN